MSDKAEKPYNLEQRTYEFAAEVRQFVKRLPLTIANQEDIKQVVRSSGAIGANYIEANESLSKKDFRMRVRIARKEAKETRYWLRLLDLAADPETTAIRNTLVGESDELLKILSAILNKSGG